MVSGRTILVLRPSIRGSPFKTRVRTICFSKAWKYSAALSSLSSCPFSAYSARRAVKVASLVAATLSCLASLSVILYASPNLSAASSLTRASSSVSTTGAVQFHGVLLTSRANSLMFSIATCCCS